MKDTPKILLLSICILLQAACSSQAVYTDESFADDSPFKMKVDGEVASACESARRSLLGQGYLIESANSDGVKARKAYKSDGTENTFIEMNVVCLPETNGSTLFATAVLSTYSLKKSSSSASVGLSALGSISLPIGQSADSLVKVSEQTIDDKDFYKRFFGAVRTILGDMKTDKPSPEPEVEPAMPEPAPVRAPTAESVPGKVTPVKVPAPAPAPQSPVTTEASVPVPAQSTPAIAPETGPAPVQESTIVPDAPEAAPVQTIPAMELNLEETSVQEPATEPEMPEAGATEGTPAILLEQPLPEQETLPASGAPEAPTTVVPESVPKTKTKTKATAPAPAPEQTPDLMNEIY